MTRRGAKKTEATRQAERRWRAANQDRVRAARRKYNDANREKRRAAALKHRQANRERLARYARWYRRLAWCRNLGPPQTALKTGHDLG